MSTAGSRKWAEDIPREETTNHVAVVAAADVEVEEPMYRNVQPVEIIVAIKALEAAQEIITIAMAETMAVRRPFGKCPKGWTMDNGPLAQIQFVKNTILMLKGYWKTLV